MKKTTITTLIILTFILTACHFPGFNNGAGLNADDAMATEIARILTGTPVQLDPATAPAIEFTETSEEIIETESVPPTQPDQPTQPVEPTAAPTQTDTPMPSPTTTPADSDPARNLGDPDWVDNMDNGDNWPTGLDKYTAIKFENGFLKLTAGTDVDGWRVTLPVIADFYLETTLQTPQCEGNDHFGLMFRVPVESQAGKGYLFSITCDGRYSLRRWDGSVMYALIGLTAHDAINQGAGVVNKLGVMANGSNLALYINGQKVNEISDSYHLIGKFGIFVGGINVNNLTVWVDQIRYWENP